MIPFFKSGQLYFHLSWVFTVTMLFCCFGRKNPRNFQPELFTICSYPLVSHFENGHCSTGAQGVMATDSWLVWRLRTNKKKGGPCCLCDLSGGYVLPPHQKGKLLSADILCKLRPRKSCWKIATIWKFPRGGSMNPSVIMSYAALGCLLLVTGGQMLALQSSRYREQKGEGR